MRRSSSRFLSSARAACLCAVLAALGQGAAAPRFIERPDSEVLLMAVRLDQQVLAEAVATYAAPGGLLVPLGELSGLLGLAIQVDTARAMAEGFLIDEGRTFLLDVPGKRAVVQGKRFAIEPGSVEVHAEDIFVHTRTLSQWLPIELVVDHRASMVVVRPRERLPVQMRRARQVAVQTALSHLRGPNLSYPLQKTPSHFLDGLSLDQNLSMVLLRGAGAAPLSDLQYATFVTGELLYLDASAFVAGTNRSLTDWRVHLGRKDPDRAMLGPLRASEVGVGDVFYPGLDLVSLPASGPGVLLSSFPLELPTHYDRHAFRGELPTGWEIELYRNDVLLGFQGSRPDGRYEFLDVPLTFGLNVFRLVLHGPHGQRREQVETFNVGMQLAPPGQLRYRLIANDPTYTGARGLGEVELGVSRYLSLRAAGAVQERLGQLEIYGLVGARAFWRRVTTNLDLLASRAGGFGAQAAVRTLLGPGSVSLEHAQLFRGFTSERLTSSLGLLSSRSTLRLDAALPVPLLSMLSVHGELRHDRTPSGTWGSAIVGRVALFQRGVALSNELSWNEFSRSSGLPAQALGAVLLSYYFSPTFALRGQLGYEAVPALTPYAGSLTAEGRLLPGYFFSVTTGINRGVPHCTLGIGKTEGVFGLRLNTEYTSTGGVLVTANLSMALARDGHRDRWHVQGQPLAASGAVSARAFLDLNGNGQKDAGEAPVPGATFLVNRAPVQQSTGQDGSAFIPNVTSHRMVELSLVSASLEDPYWSSAREGVRVVPRPGKVVPVDFPVEVLSEITGTVFVDSGGRKRPQGGIELELVDAGGKVVRSIKTAYDGFYDLTGVRPGSYTLRCSNKQLAPLRMTPPPPRTIQMDAGGTVLEGVDLVVLRGTG